MPAPGQASFFTMASRDPESGVSQPVNKTAFQVCRDAFLFAAATSVIFGPCWFGVFRLVLVLRDDEKESTFALASVLSAFTCALSHELLFMLLPFIKVKWGGYVEYRWIENLSGCAALLLSLFRYDFGGVFVLGIPESIVAMFSPTENEWLNLLRVSAAFFIGFGLWDLFQSWFDAKSGYRVGERKESVSVSGGCVSTRSFFAKFADVVAVNYFGRFLGRAFVRVTWPSLAKRAVETFVKNAFFIVTWFFLLRCALVNGDFDFSLL